MTDRFGPLQDAVKGLCDSAERLANDAWRGEKRLDALEAGPDNKIKEYQADEQFHDINSKSVKQDATKEYHDLEVSHAKKTAEAALAAGDHKLAQKWMEHGATHSEKSKGMEDPMQEPPEAKADKKRGDAEKGSYGLLQVTKAGLEKRCRDGVWEVMSEPNRFGRAEIRDGRSGKRKTITVEG